MTVNELPNQLDEPTFNLEPEIQNQNKENEDTSTRLNFKEPPRLYLSAVQKPTAIINILTGSLSDPDTLNAVIVRNQSIEICKIGHDGLRNLCMHQIFGSIIFCRLIKLPKEDVDSIFVVTERYDVMILEYAEGLNQIKTRAYGNVDTESYEKEESPLISIDPHGRCILLQIYRGIGTLLNLTLNEHNNVHFYRYNYSSKKSIDHHVIPKEIKAKSIFFDQSTILSMEFLYCGNNEGHVKSSTQPSLVLLEEHYDGNIYMSSYTINLYDNDITKNKWGRALLDKGSTLIVPSTISKYQFMVIGRELITYYSPKNLQDTFDHETDEIICQPRNKYLSLARVQNICQIDRGRYILGDDNGRVFILALLDSNYNLWQSLPENATNEDYEKMNQQKLGDIRVELLGQSVVAKSISYLDNSVLIIAADQGDNEIVKISVNKQTSIQSSKNSEKYHKRKNSSNPGLNGQGDAPVNQTGSDEDGIEINFAGTSSSKSKAVEKLEGLYNDLQLPGTCLEKIETITNIGPIVDCMLLDNEDSNGHQSQMLTCSGEEHDGSLRILKSGIGINEKLIIEFNDLHKVFALNLDAEKIYKNNQKLFPEKLRSTTVNNLDEMGAENDDEVNFLESLKKYKRDANSYSDNEQNFTDSDEDDIGGISSEPEDPILVKKKINPEHTCLLISFSNTTRIFNFQSNDIREIYFPGLETEVKTVKCFHIDENHESLLQVTKYGVYLIDPLGQRMAEFKLTNTKEMIDFSDKIDDKNFLIAAGKTLYKIRIETSISLDTQGNEILSKELKVVDTKIFKTDISCLCSNAELTAVGLWGEYLIQVNNSNKKHKTSYCELLKSEDFTLVNKINLSNTTIVRSCLISVSYKYNKMFLLISMGDGTIYTWEIIKSEIDESMTASTLLSSTAPATAAIGLAQQQQASMIIKEDGHSNLNPGTSSMIDSTFPDTMTNSTVSNEGKVVYNKKYNYKIKNIAKPMRTICSTSPTMLSNIKLVSADNEMINHVFAASDQPAVLSYNRNKLNASAVNIKHVKNCITFNSKEHPSSVLLYNDNCILLGTIDSLQKIHIRSKFLFESPKKIRYYKEKVEGENNMLNTGMSSNDLTQQSIQAYKSNKFLLATERKIHNYYKPLNPQENIPISGKADKIFYSENFSRMPHGASWQAGLGPGHRLHRDNSENSDKETSNSKLEIPTSSNSNDMSDLDRNLPYQVHRATTRTEETYNINSDNPADFEMIECNLLFIDESTFDVDLAYKLPVNEMILSLETFTISKKHKLSALTGHENSKEEEDVNKSYIVMGTALYDPDEPEPSLGRIHILEMISGRLNVVTVKEVEGAVHCLSVLGKGKIVAGINSTVIIYNFKNNIELQPETRFYNNIIVLNLDIVKNLIYVGDIMRSVAVLEYNPDDATLKELARDYNPRYTAAIKAINYDVKPVKVTEDVAENEGPEGNSATAQDITSGSMSSKTAQESQTPMVSMTQINATNTTPVTSNQNLNEGTDANAANQETFDKNDKVLPQICLCADGNNDLLMLQRRFLEGETEKQIQLQTTAAIHLGSNVTNIISGSLVMSDTINNHEYLYQHSDNSWLLTCTDGSVWSLLRIKEDIYKVFLEVQDHIRNHLDLIRPQNFIRKKSGSKSSGVTAVKESENDTFGLEMQPIGGIRHQDWRATADYIKTPEGETNLATSPIGKSKERGFIDGELLEVLLTFSKEEMKQLFPYSEIMLNEKIVTGDEIVKMIEEMSRLH